jgi:hypothetical protein
VTGLELTPKFAAPSPNAFEAGFMRISRGNDRARVVQKYNHQRVTLPLLFLPPKRHSKIPPLQRGDGPQGTIALQEYEITMKAKSRENNFRRTLRKAF